jgi:phosphoglycerate transporter family protein
MSFLRQISSALRAQPPAPPVTDPAEVDRLYRYWRVRVMYAMTTGYALFYCVRKNLSMAAKAITDEFQFSNTQWGVVLSVSTIVYALSKFLSGVVGDRANPRYLLSIGLLLSAVVNLVFGLGASLAFFIVFWALNNLFQGTGVPPCVRLLTSWYSPTEIGRAWGIWNASHQIGGAVIAVWAAWLVSHYGWRSAFWVPGIVGVVGAIWLHNRLTDSPESKGLPAVETYREGTAAGTVADTTAPFWGVFRRYILSNPWVWIVSIANFFVYVVRIGILDWAPKYLQEAKGFNLKEAGYSLSGFEVAGIFGAYASGWLSDRVFRGRRGPVSVAFMLFLIVFVVALFFVPRGSLGTMSAVFIAIGFFVYGPQMLIAVAAADFATKAAASSAVGLTGLFGYLGATLCGVATGLIADHLGWDGVLWFYGLAAVAGAALLATTWSKRPGHPDRAPASR